LTEEKVARYQTPEEVKKEHVEALGEPLGLLFEAIWREVAWLYHRWQEFHDLYASKTARVDLLNKAAPAFFRTVQDVLFEAIVLNIALLTDPPESVGKRNLTIQRLPLLIQDEETSREVKERVRETLEAAEFCRDWRNRRLAHRDLALALEEEPVAPLQLANVAKVLAALGALSATLNVVSEHYLQSTIHFDWVGPSSGGAISLLHLLRDGVRAQEEREERLRRGEPQPGDFEHPDI
jgi:AbiU2